MHGNIGRGVLLGVAFVLGQVVGGQGGAAHELVGLGGGGLALLEAANQGPLAAVLLAPPQADEQQHDEDPVDVVGDDGAVGGRVLPAKQGVEDLPTVVSLWVAAVDVPDRLTNVVGAGARAVLGDVAAGLLGEDVHLEVPDGAREQAGGNEIEEAGGGDEEDLDGQVVAAAVDEVANGDTGGEAADDGDGEGGGRGAERDTADEDNELDTLTQGGDEGQQGHGVLAGPGGGLHALPDGGLLVAGGLVGVENGLCDLDSPLFLHLVETQHGETHDADHDGRDDGEDAFPQVFGGGPDILAERVEDADEGTTDTQTDEDTGDGADPDLPDKTLVQLLVLVGAAETLLEEGEQDRDDDGGFQRLAERDEEDFNGEDVDHF